MKNLKPVVAVQDDNGHWYVIPRERRDEFYWELEMIEIFPDHWNKYRTGGDLNLVQLYAEI